MPPLSVFLPVYNEEAILVENTEALWRFLVPLGVPFEILIGSNGSTDRTVPLGGELQGRYPQVRFFHVPDTGAGSAFRRAVAMMRYEYVVCLDMDLSVALEFITQALRSLETADVVIGSKKMGVESRSAIRRWGSDFFIICSKRLLGLPFDDYSIGAKAYRAPVLRRYQHAIGRGTFYVQRLVYLASQDGLKIVEVPARCEDFRRSRFNLIWEGGYRFVCLVWLWWSCRHRADASSGSQRDAPHRS